VPETLLQTIIKKLQDLLTARTVPTEPPEELRGVEGFDQLYSTLLEVRTVVMAFASGDLGRQITRKGYLPGSLKALQAALQHLAWQTKMIASGDFSQRVDFMGEFSDSFNRMVQQLDESMQKLTVANRQLEESQTRIQESLNCAKVIQSSILPRGEQFERLFNDWFALYRPCEVVGGDLYWLREINGQVLLAVIDCTGHGVPGAFMTMTVNSVLNHIVDTICSDDPGRILSEMNRVLQETLHLRLDNKSMVDAGLDMVVCCIDPAKHRLTYAGAGLSLYIFDDGELCEIKGDRAGIGYSSSAPDLTFTNNVRDLGAGTICYAITDGFLDEGGGPRGFGFGRQRFKEMVARHAGHPLKRQQELFEVTLDEWRGSRKQRDDITVVGFRF
jgi:phosphoserine phosphatase RsbU/P